VKRRLFLASTALTLTGCAHESNALNQTGWVRKIVDSAESFDAAVIDDRGNAKLYLPRDISATFPIDSFPTPASGAYRMYVRDDFASYRLHAGGAVESPREFSLRDLRSLRSRSQITRHDCVEGWSAIGMWRGVLLGDLLTLIVPSSKARFVVFRCMDMTFNHTLYYESLDLRQARHPQTLLALDFNGKPLRPEHGAPVRLRVPTQLGYKSAKWIYRIELVPSLANIGSGKGGFWEDQGYEWFAGI